MTSIASSQTVNGPILPSLSYGDFGDIRILADTVKITKYLPGSYYPTPSYRMVVYSFNDNNRIDTMFYRDNNRDYGLILKYSDKNQLLSVSDYTPRQEDPDNPGTFIERMERLSAESEYGEDGRMSKHRMCYYPVYLEGSSSSSVDTTFVYRYTVTDSSYIWNDSVECILDNLGRVTNLKNLNRKEEYVFDSEGRKYQNGDMTYSYFDGGYTSLRYYKIDIPPGLNGGIMSDGWWKEDYYFQEDGYMSKKIVYFKDRSDPEWKMYDHEEYTYHYKSDNPGSILTIEQSEGKVYATEGGIVFEMEKMATVRIYSFNGQIITQQKVSVGTNHIELPKGLYIIAINGQSNKVSVR